MTSPTFNELAAALLETAIEGDSIVVATANGDNLMLQCRPTCAEDLVQIARAVLNQAAETAARETGFQAVHFLHEITAALNCLPDPHADDDGEHAE
jgi:hypothetical protein